MSPFKTKKLPKKVREASSSLTIEKDSQIMKPLFSAKFIVGILLGCLCLFFVAQIALRALSGNQQNGSETFVPKETIDEDVNEKVKGTTNILIAGIGGKGHDGSDLTDSIMLASLDSEKNIITLLSIPRDLYVAYPLSKGSGRINTLYDLGKRDTVGITYLAKKISEITGQSIDHYFVIDFSGFKQIIDILGGVNIDVPEALVDREYPDNNWGYTTFSVRAGLQNFDGETALKYARSRHSTSDFDRSNRQQLILKGIKERATDLGIITSPSKISDIYEAILSHIDTDLSIAAMADLALEFADIKSDNIGIISLSESCFSLSKCAPGSYLYSPSRDLFGGSAVIIPENAQANKLSYYTDIRRFVDLTFRFPLLRTNPREIVLVSDPSMRKRTLEIGVGLAKLGFPISFDKSLIMATGSIEKSHVNIYWNPDLSVGINPESVVIESMKYIEESLPYVIVEANEYANTSGPKIEVVIGKDGGEYFKQMRSTYYIPAPPRESLSGESALTGSKVKKKNTGDTSGTPTSKNESLSGERKISPGEWENF